MENNPMDREEYFKELGRKKVKNFCLSQYQECEETDLSLLLKYCPDLESIEFSFDIIGQDLSLLKNFRHLSSVTIEEALLLNTADFSKIFELPHLKSLEINHYKIGSDFCIHLARCEQLTSLSLSGCEYFGDQDLRVLAGLKNLKRLDLYGAERLTDEGIKSISLFPQLVELVLGGCRSLSNEAMKSVGELTKLEVLSLECLLMDQKGFAHLESLAQLKVLNAYSCKGLDDLGMQSLRCFKNLSQLNLSHCWNVSEAGFSYLSELGCLTHLDVSRTQFSDKNLRALSTLSELGSLNLGSCDCLTASGFDKIAQIKSLIDFDLSYCEAVDDSVLKQIAHMPSLRTLDLTGCHQKITDVGLEYLSNHQKLCHLTFKHCDEITRKGLISLADGLPELESIFISYCKNISSDDIKAFKNAYPKIAVFS
jgi:F-box/leucine-rich repeat protein 14